MKVIQDGKEFNVLTQEEVREAARREYEEQQAKLREYEESVAFRIELLDIRCDVLKQDIEKSVCSLEKFYAHPEILAAYLAEYETRETKEPFKEYVLYDLKKLYRGV